MRHKCGNAGTRATEWRMLCLVTALSTPTTSSTTLSIILQQLSQFCSCCNCESLSFHSLVYHFLQIIFIQQYNLLPFLSLLLFSQTAIVFTCNTPNLTSPKASPGRPNSIPELTKMEIETALSTQCSCTMTSDSIVSGSRRINPI